MSTTRASWRARVSAWLTRWRPLLPLMGAELIVMIGFGALLPVLPLFVQEQGVNAVGLGVVIAGWPIAKLIFEPVFGWWADRHERKPQMVAGLLVLAVVSVLPLFLTSFLALFLLRFAAGVATAAYDPAARGIIVEATEEDERGEAFGYYGSFQVAGFAIGPAIGGLGAAVFGGYAFPFVFVGALAVVGAFVVARYLLSHPHAVESTEFDHRPEAQPLPAGVPFSASETAAIPTDPLPPAAIAPISAVLNRMVIASLLLTFGLHLSFGVYEVVWSLYMIALGASVAWIGFTFVLFAVPEMVVGPMAGRLVDRRGPVGMIIGSWLVISVVGLIYASARTLWIPSAVVPFEAAATAAMMPALYSMLARGTPRGRASTAQGIFGSTSTLALVLASLAAGGLFELDIGYPFLFFVGGMAICLIVGLLIYRSASRDRVAPGTQAAV